jgi:hypothetical protein
MSALTRETADPVSYPMPASCASIEDVRAILLRNAYASYRDPLWDTVSEVTDHSFILYGEYDYPFDANIPFEITVSYADGMLHYTASIDGPLEMISYVTEFIIPRIHPK